MSRWDDVTSGKRPHAAKQSDRGAVAVDRGIVLDAMHVQDVKRQVRRLQRHHADSARRKANRLSATASVKASMTVRSPASQSR